MHPILVTIPGLLFKLVVPALILWGIYALTLTLLKRPPVPQSETPSNTALQPTDDKHIHGMFAIVTGIGLFLFSAPVQVRQGSPASRLLFALKEFALRVVDVSVWQSSWNALPIYSYGVMLGLSFLVGWFLTLHYGAQQGLSRDKMAECYIVTAISAVLGSRLLYIITNLSEFRDPVSHKYSFTLMFALRNGGLVAYGGFLGGLLGSLIFLRRQNISFWQWADAAVPSLASGLFLTRIGCYLYGCDFGKPLTANAPHWLRTIGTFPHWQDDQGSPAWQQHVSRGFQIDFETCRSRYHGQIGTFTDRRCYLPHEAEHSASVHPTQLYESLTGLVIFLVLVWLWRRRKFDGQIFFAFAILYGFARSALEVLRDDEERGFYRGFSTSQLIGLVTAVVCLGLYFWRHKQSTTLKTSKQ